MFKKYHYLDHNLNPSAINYCMTINNVLCSFISIMHFPHPINTKIKRVHRLVVLPDFQGIGIGKLLLNLVSELYEQFTFSIVTSQPALIQSLIKDKQWINTRNTRNTRNTGILSKGLNKTLSNKRITFTFVKKVKNNG